MESEKYYYIEDEQVPERNLWCAVLARAAIDAEEIYKKLQLSREDKNRKRFLDQAFCLMCECEHEWMEHICELASMDRNYFVAHIKNILYGKH